MGWTSVEFAAKTARVRHLMEREDLDGVLLTSQVNFYWLTGGRGYINPAVERACGDILVTGDKVWLIANNIEADRLLDEELAGLAVAKAEFDWWDSAGATKAIATIMTSGRIRTDIELGTKFAALRWQLLPEELEKYREVGQNAARSVEAVAFGVTPGLSEQEIAARLRQAALQNGVFPWVSLVAADERAFTRRHPLPGGKTLEQYAMLVLSGQQYGLYASVTRLVHFGKPSEELRRRHEAVVQVDAAFIAGTTPGATIGEVFQSGLAAYAQAGFADEWRNHHQGGLTAYASREVRATADSAVAVAVGQAYAWNPTIAGVKSEDTILVGPGGPEVITQTGDFPLVKVNYRGIVVERPAILER